MVVAPRVGELGAQPGRDDHVAGRLTGDRALDALQGVRVERRIEQVAVAGHRPAASAVVLVLAARLEPHLAPVAADGGPGPLAPADDVGGRGAGETGGGPPPPPARPRGPGR